MKGVNIHFIKVRNNQYWLVYNQELFKITIYDDGKFHNKLYECEKEIPEELVYFVEMMLKKEARRI